MNKKHENKPLSEGAIISKSFRYPLVMRLSKRLPKARNSKILVLSGLIIFVLAVGSLLVISNRNKKEPEITALKVGKYSYTQSQYNMLISQAKEMKVNEFAARKALKEALASRQAADDLKINYPTDQGTLNSEAARMYNILTPDPAINEYQRDTAYMQLIKPFVTFGVHGGYRVGYVEFPFSRYIVAGDDSQFHNEKLINDDINYAKTQAQQYREAVNKKKQSITEVVNKVRADTRLTYGQAGNVSDVFFADEAGNMYSSFSTSNTVQSSLLKAIKQAEVGKVSDIMTRSFSNSTSLALPSIQHGTDIDVAYYFIIVETKTSARPTLQTDYNKLFQGYSS
jgi:hypothetical protein